jgi:hypothetical protein
MARGGTSSTSSPPASTRSRWICWRSPWAARKKLKLGLWTYHRALALYCLENELGEGAERPSWRTYLRALLHAPRHLFVSLPAEVRRAHAAGMTVEVVECVRGLEDGYYERPLPLERLGLK